MPSWAWTLIWILLVLAFLAVCVSGIAYAVLHLMRLGRTAGKTAARVGKKIDAIVSGVDESEEQQKIPFFVRPFQDVHAHYLHAQVRKARRNLRKHERHCEQWERWSKPYGEQYHNDK